MGFGYVQGLVNCSASKEFAITTGLTRINYALKMFVSIIFMPRTKYRSTDY